MPERSAEKAIPSEIQTELDRAKGFTDADRYSEFEMGPGIMPLT